MAKATLEQLEAQRVEEIDANRDLGVIASEPGKGDALSDEVYEVIQGKHILPDGRRLGPGQRFRPTRRQVENNSLRGKARELSGREYRGLRRPREDRPARIAGADIGIRALPMAQGTLRAALEAGLTEEDFAGLEPAGPDGQYTRKQVDELIAAKKAAGDDGGTDA